MDNRVMLTRALDSHPKGMLKSEVDDVFIRAGWSRYDAKSAAYRVMQSLISEGVAIYDWHRGMLIPTGKGLVMTEIMDGKEVKVVY